jgi:hypothetical protein
MGNILEKIFKNPDLTLYNLKNEIYLRRWWILPKRMFPFNVYLHNFMSSDASELHDHPWWSISIILSGSYREHIPVDEKGWVENGDRKEIVKIRYPFIPTFRNANAIHRIELFKLKLKLKQPRTWLESEQEQEREQEQEHEQSVWTIFITGPKVRNWGFYCPKGFVHHKDFLNVEENALGAGCG